MVLCLVCDIFGMILWNIVSMGWVMSVWCNGLSVSISVGSIKMMVSIVVSIGLIRFS